MGSCAASRASTQSLPRAVLPMDTCAATDIGGLCALFEFFTLKGEGVKLFGVAVFYVVGEDTVVTRICAACS